MVGLVTKYAGGVIKGFALISGEKMSVLYRCVDVYIIK